MASDTIWIKDIDDEGGRQGFEMATYRLSTVLLTVGLLARPTNKTDSKTPADDGTKTQSAVI